MRKTATVPELDLSIMLEKIRQDHVDINQIIRVELDEILPQYIKEIVSNVYSNLKGDNNE